MKSPPFGEFSIEGASLEVPPGALRSSVDVHLAAETPSAPIPEDTFLEGRIYSLTPHGTTFVQPALLTMDAPAEGTDLVVMRLDNAEDMEWEEVPEVTFQNGKAQISLSHFSFYAIFRRLRNCRKNDGGCDANATCSQHRGGVTCTCKAGFAGNGKSCHDMNECANASACDAHATCTNAVGSYACACNSGYDGDGHHCTDIDECARGIASCDSHTTCHNTDGSYACDCAPGFIRSGSACVDLNECLTNNGGCDANATCTNTAGSFVCTCDAGWAGDGTTCADVNECLTSHDACGPNATCTNIPGNAFCACDIGFHWDGATCVDIDECATGNGGCDPNARCVNFPGSRTCECGEGYIGNGLACTDMNECLTNNGGCDANATCANTAGSRTCSCQTGWIGNGEQCTDIDECQSNNGGCDANASCTNIGGGNTCACRPGSAGDGFTCEAVDVCATNNGGCDAHATCANVQGGRTCTCAPGLTGNGLTCTDVNECATNNGGCSAYATCTNTAGSRTCACNQGYTGDGFTCTTSLTTCDQLTSYTDLNGCTQPQWGALASTAADDQAVRVAYDPSGNFYVLGVTSGALDGNTSSGGTDVFLRKYSPGRLPLWSLQFGSAGTETPRGLAIDHSGSVFITGSTTASLHGQTFAGGTDLFLVKYDPNGTRLWTREIGTPTNDDGNAVTIDAQGNAYVVGATNGNFDALQGKGGLDLIALKYDGNGNKLWSTLVGSTSGDTGEGITVDASGNVFLAGTTTGVFPGLESNYDEPWPGNFMRHDPYSSALVVKLDGTTGGRLWAALGNVECVDGASGTPSCYDAITNMQIGAFEGKAVYVTSTGNIVLAAQRTLRFSSSAGTLYSWHVAKLDANGTRLATASVVPEVNPYATWDYGYNAARLMLSDAALGPNDTLLLWGWTDTYVGPRPHSSWSDQYTMGGAVLAGFDAQLQLTRQVLYQSTPSMQRGYGVYGPQESADSLHGGNPRGFSDLKGLGLAVDANQHVMAAGSFSSGTYVGLTPPIDRNRDGIIFQL